MTIPLREAGPPAPAHRHFEPPHRWFIGASLALAIGGGFALGLAVAMTGALEEPWADAQTATQLHGQLQLIGFAGIFTMGMALRLMPRFSGRPLAFAELVWPMLIAIVASLVIRGAAQPSGTGALRDAALIISALLLIAGALAFAAIVTVTLVSRQSRGEATSYFFVAGALAFLASSALNFFIVIDMVMDDIEVAATADQQVLVFVLQYGFNLAFISGVTLRAVPALTGHARPDLPARIVAVVLACGVALAAACAWRIADDGPSSTLARAENVGLLFCAGAFVATAWLSGVMRPAANRVGGASQTAFWFVRSTMLWLLASALLLTWYAANGLADGAPPQAFALDAVRHMLALGVITMMILGMGTLVLPEFAGRRLLHPDERLLTVGLVVAANIAVALRVWPSIEGIEWIESTRYWPMAIAGWLAEAVLLIFAAMFVQSIFEQRRPGWNQRPPQPPA